MRLLLRLCWNKDDTEDRHVRYGEVVADMGEWKRRPTAKQMSQAMHAALMELAEVKRVRRKRR